MPFFTRKPPAQVRAALRWMLAEAFDASAARLDDLSPKDGAEELDAMIAVLAWAGAAGVDTKWIAGAVPSEADQTDLRARWADEAAEKRAGVAA